MALHTAGFAAQVFKRDARRELDAGLGRRNAVVAGHALDRGAQGSDVVDDARFGAVIAQEVTIAGGAVALGAAHGNATCGVPIVERYGGLVIVP